MKTKASIFSAIIGLATLMAFEHPPSSAIKRYRLSESNPASCEAINVGCDSLRAVQCLVASPIGTRWVWGDTGCADAIYHSSPNVLPPE